MRLVQMSNDEMRCVAVVEEPSLRIVNDEQTVYALAMRALASNIPLTALVTGLLSDMRISYDEVYAGASHWHLLSPVDVPYEPQKLLVSGTGLTHLGSARERQAMHLAEATTPDEVDEAAMTDSMRMFKWGQQNGRPAGDAVGIAPEWFYKGDGSIVRAPFEVLTIPGHAEDGGEEAEVATVYLIAQDGTPHRIGMAAGNECSDHVFERHNYLNLAGSKLRECSLGPELVIGAPFDDIPGRVRIMRQGATLWEKAIRTGEANMAHSLANLEHHHFKFDGHRQPGTVHVHFLGADALSFGAGVKMQQDDIAEVHFEGMGRPLRNPVHVQKPLTAPVRVQVMS